MNALDYVIAGAGGLIVLAATGATGYILIATRLKHLATRVAVRDMRRHPAYPPPVPGAPSPAWRIFPTYRYGDVDATWLDAWPTDEMPQSQVDRLFDDIVAMEGLQ